MQPVALPHAMPMPMDRPQTMDALTLLHADQTGRVAWSNPRIVQARTASHAAGVSGWTTHREGRDRVQHLAPTPTVAGIARFPRDADALGERLGPVSRMVRDPGARHAVGLRTRAPRALAAHAA